MINQSFAAGQRTEQNGQQTLLRNKVFWLSAALFALVFSINLAGKYDDYLRFISSDMVRVQVYRNYLKTPGLYDDRNSIERVIKRVLNGESGFMPYDEPLDDDADLALELADFAPELALEDADEAANEAADEPLEIAPEDATNLQDFLAAKRQWWRQNRRHLYAASGLLERQNLVAEYFNLAANARQIAQTDQFLEKGGFFGKYPTFSEIALAQPLAPGRFDGGLREALGITPRVQQPFVRTGSAGQTYRILALKYKHMQIFTTVNKDLFVNTNTEPPSRLLELAQNGARTPVAGVHSFGQPLSENLLVAPTNTWLFARFYGVLELSFWDYLRGFVYLRGDLYPAAGSSAASSLAPSQKDFGLFSDAFAWLDAWRNRAFTAAERFIDSQHASAKMREFYGALFLARPISTELRRDVNFYSIAHLLAISGYHLGLIFACLYFLLQRLLPLLLGQRLRHINRRLIIVLLCFAALSVYFALIGLVPSFLRSFAMAALALVVQFAGLRLFSFRTLLAALALCIALDPTLIFSIGFYFSALGVFYIYLFAHHFSQVLRVRHIQGRQKGVVVVQLGAGVVFFEAFIFFMMIIPVLGFFELLSMQQVAALVITPAFVVFYPIAALAHIFHIGGIFDGYMQSFLDIKMFHADFAIHPLYTLVYVALSIYSVHSKRLALALLALNGMVFACGALVFV